MDRLRADEKLGGQLVHAAHLPASPAVYGSLEPELPAPLPAALAQLGVRELFRHQTEGIAAVRRGEDVLVTTPTASGKSLIFQLPVLEAAARGETGHALFLFPLKALGQDQRGKLLALAELAGLGPKQAGCEIYDGDTPRSQRTKIRQCFPRVVVSNPDMLHLGVLGHWTGWGPFLAELRWIVLDELHTYRGIFGSHFHHVLQRFLRLCRSLGANPQIVASSATAANASEFAAELTGRRFHWIAESGAPREGRHFLLFRPPASPYTTALQLFVRCVRAGLKTIVFTKARRITELLYSWLRRQEPQLAARVASYRAGFLAEERRRIEQALFSGRLDGVISTSALEMGIDVGGLDACILVGYPGSMMATWQRSGRVGRAGRDSITALVALPDALDQYLLDHPEEFLGRPCERLIVDPQNDPVSRAHLVCAASEMPLSSEDRAYTGPHAARIEKLLRQGHLLSAEGSDEVFCLRRRPQRLVALRGTGETFAILADGRTVGTVDGVRVLHECHPGAVYLHAGRQYLVESLEHEERKVKVKAEELEYFTTPMTEKETEILEVLEERTAGPLASWLCRLKVTERVVGFERKRIFGQETIDRTPLELPPVEYETVGLAWAVPAAVEETLRCRGEHFLGALHAAEHAGISLFPLLAICDRGDIGGISYPIHPQLGTGAVFIYDGHPGGVGIAAKGFADLTELLGRVIALIEGCACDKGCPSCIHSPKCGNGNRPLDKQGAARALRLLLGREEPAVAWGETPRITFAETESLVPTLCVGTDSCDALRHEDAERPPASPRGAWGRGRTVLFDLETLRGAADVGGWRNIHRMGVAIGVVCHLEEGRFEVFREGDVKALVGALRSATLVIGYNVKRFDYRVLAGYTGEDYCRLLPTLDLFEEVTGRLGFRIGMGHLALETLGHPKSADGLQSLEWVREGRLDLVEDYCRKDVEILRDLYLHGRREGFVVYHDRRREVRLRIGVEW